MGAGRSTIAAAAKARRRRGTQPRADPGARQILLRRRREVLRQGRDLRPVRAAARTAAQFPERDVVARDFALMARDGRQHGARLHRAAAVAARPRRRSRPARAGRHSLVAARHLPRRSRRSSARSCARGRGGARPEPPSARSSPISSATRSRPTWCAGTGRSGCARFLKRLVGLVKDDRSRAASSATPISPRPNISPSISPISSASTSISTRKTAFRRYLSRLHNLAVDRPLVLTEFGIDSMREGDDEQARILSWQIAHRLRDGRRRHLRLRLDRRMVHRRPSDRGLGLRPGRSRRACRSPPSPRCEERYHGPIPPRLPRMPARLGRGLRLQRRAHDGRRASPRSSSSTIPITRSSSSMTARPTARSRSPSASAIAASSASRTRA